MSFIKLSKPLLKEGRSTSTITTSRDLRKYIKTNHFFMEYDDEIYADDSILNIPLTATILPLAWLAGVDVTVESLDKKFKDSMDLLQKTFSETYPLGIFNSEIKTMKLVDNIINPKDSQNTSAMLFSGGVDSTYSLYKNLSLNPKLIMIWGVDDFPYPERYDYWTKVISTYTQWAERNKLELKIIKTNISQILDNRRTEHKFHKVLYDGDIRDALQHSLVLLPATAPLSVGRFNNLIIAASGSRNNPMKPRAARPQFDEKIIWADLKVNHHGFIPRHDKVLTIRQYIDSSDVTLKVCLRSGSMGDNLNDSTCEKCLRTIISLVLAGVDPNKCGFKVDESTFLAMKSYWINRKSTKSGRPWLEIQTIIPEKIEHDFYGSKEFLEWFKQYNLSSTERGWFYNDLYHFLPYPIAQLLDKIYYKYGINVHESPRKRIS